MARQSSAGTVTSVLVPWDTCGAYISGVLGVPTASYFRYGYFNLLSPVLDVLYGFLGFKVPRAASPLSPDPESGRGAVDDLDPMATECSD